MSLFFSLVFIVFFIFLILISPRQKILIRSVYLFIPIALIAKVFGDQSNVLLYQISFLLENLCIVIILYLITNRLSFKRNVKAEEYFNFLILFLLLVYFSHNLSHYEILIDKYWQTDVRVVSPWSIFIFVSAFILIFYNEKVETALLFNHWFQFLSLLSLIFISLYTLTYLFLIEGNVDKSFIGTGGIGLNNFSTNETGFYAVTLGISWFYLQKFKKGLPGFLAIIFMFIFFTITILTKSRISSLLFLLIVFGDLFSKRNIWGYRLLVLSLLMIMTFFGLNEILDRFQTDYRTSYNYLLPEIPFTGSGRTLIWYYFLDNFFRSDIISLLFGVGDFGIIKIYDSTPLKNLGVYSASTKSFLPLHSEIFDILISGGLLSLLAFSLVVYFILKKYKNFYDLKLMIIGLSFYLFFDMVVYNFIALLIFSLNIIFILKNESIDE